MGSQSHRRLPGEGTSIYSLHLEHLRIILTQWEAHYEPIPPDPLMSHPLLNLALYAYTDRFYQALTKLQLVSRQLRNAIGDYPFLWRRICPSMPHDKRRSLLETAEPLQVPLIVDATPTYGPPLDKFGLPTVPDDNQLRRYSDFIKDVCGVSHRWQTLRYISPWRTYDEIALSLFSHPAPGLETIEVKLSYAKHSWDVPSALFSDTATPIEIRTSGFHFPWTSKFTSRVKWLDSQFEIGPVPPIKGPGLLDLLGRPGLIDRLETIRIQTVEEDDRPGEDFDHWDVPSITLPSLKYLEVSQLSTRQIQRLFRRIEAPHALIKVRGALATSVSSAHWVASWFGRHLHNGSCGKQKVFVHHRRTRYVSESRPGITFIAGHEDDSDLVESTILSIIWSTQRCQELTTPPVIKLCVDAIKSAPAEWAQSVDSLTVWGLTSDYLSEFLRIMDPRLPNVRNLCILEEDLGATVLAIDQSRPGSPPNRPIFPHVEIV